MTTGASAAGASPATPPFACPACGGDLLYASAEASCRTCRRSYACLDGIWRLTIGASGAAGYDPHYFPSLHRVEDVHFWFVVRRDVILDALRAVVPDLASAGLLDVGCGTGAVAAYLEKRGVGLDGACDAHLSALAVTRDRVRAPVALVDDGRFPPLAPGRTLVGLFDVLEHIDDDEGALRSVNAALRPAGRLVLTVPAHPFLFDEADRLACHRRRYTGRELRRKLEAAGFVVERVTHFMATLVPGLVAARLAGRALAPWLGTADTRRNAELRPMPLVNGLLRRWLQLERAWLRVGTLPFGTSLLAIARRPEVRVS